MVSPDQVSEMLNGIKESIKFSIMIGDVEVYITDILVNNNGLKVEFVTQHPEREDEIRPHVEQCIMKLISDEENREWKSKEQSSPILSKIKSIFQR